LQVVGSQPADSIVVYATSAGTTAADGTGRNGLFTTHLLNNLKTSGLEIAEVFRRTGADVSRASDRKQIPAIYNQFFGIAYLGGTTSQSVPAPQPTPAVTALQVPRNVRAGTLGTDRVTLNWDSAGSGVSYKVYWSGQNNPSGARALGDPVSGTSMNISTLASATNYYFWVSSVKDGQESGKSPVVSILTAAAVPVNPSPNVPSDMVKINGGTFMMGSPASEADREDRREVQHQVTVSSFYMGKYEVTQREYTVLMGTNPSYFKGDNLPVECVNWYDAVNYCNARSRSEGLTPAYTIDKTRKDPNNTNDDDYDMKWTVTWNRNANGYRLPTEAEWEYACRAGTTTPFSTGSNITTNQANYNGDTWPYNGNTKGTNRDKTTAVGSFAANRWGLYDMHGNVSEWCWDWSKSYASGSQTDPLGASSSSERAWRGGSWSDAGENLRSAYRGCNRPSYSTYHFGFRLLRPSL
jgi:formylglycine-generating enzyme required for sulfatase activity